MSTWSDYWVDPGLSRTAVTTVCVRSAARTAVAGSGGTAREGAPRAGPCPGLPRREADPAWLRHMGAHRGRRAQRRGAGLHPASGDRAPAGRLGRGGPGAPGAARHDSAQEARNRSLAVAETFANATGTREALDLLGPTTVLQPSAEAARKASKVDFVVVLNTDGIRYTHPKPDRIGKKFIGTLEPALRGEVVVEQITGTIGPLVQATVPVEGPGGKAVGAVPAGITLENVGGVSDRQLPILLGSAAAALSL